MYMCYALGPRSMELPRGGISPSTVVRNLISAGPCCKPTGSVDSGKVERKDEGFLSAFVYVCVCVGWRREGWVGERRYEQEGG